MTRTLSLVALALAATLTVAGCGSNDISTSSATSSSTSSSSSDFNDADVTFAQSMIPHHEQAVQMAKMAVTNASSPEVKQLAEKIEAAQGPEIETMTGWLKDWGKKLRSGADSDMGGMDHDMVSTGSGDMPGMMSGAEMKKLNTATGAGFNSMFLTMMIEHHTGAIEMAKTEQANGKSADAVALAKKIEADQTAEIAQMKQLLKS
jgi:uncharacterized protein (DUF305 family)